MKITLSIFVVFERLIISIAYRTHHQGSITQWVNFTGTRNQEFTQQITFKSTFRNTPQVFVTPWVMDFDTYSPYGFQLMIPKITTTYFNVTMTLSCSNAYSIAFLQLAIDGARFEIISKFKISNSQSTSLSHSNKNALSGFIVTMNFIGRSCRLFFRCLIIKSLKYSRNYIRSYDYIYSIILGPVSAFNTSRSTYNSPLKDINWDQFYFIFTKQFSFDPSTGGLMRFRLQPLVILV